MRSLGGPQEASVYTAELHAIKRALEFIIDSPGNEWTIFTDSQSSIMAIKDFYPSHPIVQEIQGNLIEIEQINKKITFCKVPSHVGVRGNEMADTAANEARNLPGLHTSMIPHRDFRPTIRKAIKNKWQTRWDRSTKHLRQLKPTVGPWPPTNYEGRSGEAKISRLRIGHTRLTHGYYMSRTRPPECSKCRASPLTIQHILVDCQFYQPYRISHGLPNNYQAILGENCPVSKLIKFLKEIDIFKDI